MTRNNLESAAARPAGLVLALALAFVLAPTTAAPASAQSVDAQPVAPTVVPSYYFGFAGGVTDTHSGDVGHNLSAVLGKPGIYSTLRGQIEASYSSAFASRSCCYAFASRSCCYSESEEIAALSVIASLFYDFRKGKAFRPFVGAGLLYQVQSVNSHLGEVLGNWSGNGLGGQWTIGLAYEIKPQWIVQGSRRIVAGVHDQQQFQLGLRIGR